MPQQAPSDPSDVPSSGQPVADEEAIRIVEVDIGQLETVYALNLVIFNEERIINTFDREDLMILVAYVGEQPVGFKIGYRESRFVYYSAKGGVLPEFRRRGLARMLLEEMLTRVRARGYVRLAFDTFPNRHPGMTILALREGFKLTKADFNPTYRDYRLRFEKKL